MRANFDGVADPQERGVIPAGTYLMEVTHIEQKETRNRDTMWHITLVVVGGEHKGAYVWDNLVWSVNAYPRVKGFLQATGMLRKGEVEYTMQDFVGKRIMVSINETEYEGKKQNKVDFAGYAPAGNQPPRDENDPGEPSADIDDTPF